MIIVSRTQFQPGEGPSRGLLCDCTTGCGTDGALHSTNQDTAAPAPDQVLSCLDTEVARYRDLNARLLAEIQENKGQLAELGRTTDTRRKMVTQLEFDVNVIERESKRLQVEIVLSPNCSPGHNFGQQMTRSTLNFWTLLI